jgi:predicted transcriptional regulator
MGVTKTDNFSKEQNQIADFAKAFAHPARVAIIQHLLKTQTCICNDLVEVLPLSQSTISQHLNELKRIGLIKGAIDGPKVCYCINDETWERAKTLLRNILESFETCC